MAGSQNQAKSKGRRGSKNTNHANPPPPQMSNPNPPQLTPTLSDTNSVHFNNVNPSPNLSSDFKNRNYCNAEQLEDLVLKKLQIIYNEALVRLISCGYHRDVALKAILTNGHGFGNMDFLNNIVHNSLGYLRTGMVVDNGTYRQGQQVFEDINLLIKNSLSVMIHLLRQVRPNLTKGAAMWCLRASEFQLGLATTLNVPVFRVKSESYVSADSIPLQGNQNTDDDFGNSGASVNSSGGVLETDLKLFKRFNLTPSLASELKKNVVEYAAAYRANMKVSPEQPQPVNNSTWPIKKSSDQFEWEESCMVNLMMGSLGRLSLNEQPETNPLDPKIEVISTLVHQIKEVKEQLKERQEWAHKKVIQAAKRVSQHLIELKMLRLERKEKQQAKSRKLQAEQETMKRLLEMENALRKACSQADLANAAVKGLEIENAGIRAEMEAFKLSASETDKMCVEITKKERKCLKRIAALEKQNNKIQQEIEEEKRKSLQLQQQLLHLKEAKEDFEVKWRQEVQAKELAITQVQEELRLQEEDEVKLKTKQEAMRQKRETDCQCWQDDMQRLEQQISGLQLSFDFADSYLEFERTQRDTVGLMVTYLSVLPDSSEEETCYRKCLICMENEASIIFLPCSHLILCANCTDNHCDNVEARCLCCHERILQRIYVYGASS